ncbi:hypothetical protein EJ05DRAFT_333479 [Pseudovirgaria hyperparasitica]|uniref:Uncharacterized protein n=1 Tax=Pseudovirgaria hyperparasitica TaxID=470096 RepID=A0A6A6WDD7_9PEZI|nr:uncharacterized protein EJ05DRAFT_333479 [Pseudovirgaria hyperparasitica]KAF2759121.1 hypothetical protein EJ05DRAFT_333479 [Pseudovirgaria hyperparasitica]
MSSNARALAPVQEVLILTPQRSHLPFPMNVNAPDETTPLSEAAEFDEKTPELKKRRATLPSVVTNSAEVSALAAVWSQSGTKVTAAEEQALKSPSHSQIGIALSSPNQALRVHRKSQSAGALRDLARRHNEPLLAPNNKTSRAPMRRRSAEIRYWRESVGARSFSVYSDLAPREDIDDSVVDDDKEIEVYEGAAAADNPVEQKARAMGPSHILAFNFGDLAEATPTAAPAHSSENVVDSRSQRSVSARSEPTQQYAAPRSKPQTVIIADAPKEKRSSRQRSSSTVRENFSRPSSVREASSAAAAHAQAQKSFPPTAASTPLPSRTPRTAAAQHDEKTAGHVPTTVRPSEPSAHDPDFPSPATQFHAIYTILRHERSARKVLEKQILALNREVSDLRALTLKMSRNNGGGAGTYPTPSPDLANHSADASSFRREAEDEFRHEDEGLGQSLGYDHLAAWQDGFAPNDRRRETAISRFSKFDTEDEAEDASSRADDEEGAEEEEEEEEEEANADADDDDNDDDDDDDNDNDALAKLHRASAQTHTTHESEGLVMKSAPARKRTPPTTNSTKAGSVSVSQNSSAHSTNVGSPDVWETPLEEAVAYGFGFGHEDGSSGNGNAGHAASRVVSPGRSGAGDEDMF